VNLAIRDALVRVQGSALVHDVRVDPQAGTVAWQGRSRAASTFAWQPPVTGAVYGTLLNDRAALVALAEAAGRPPYKASPKAPVLYVKPRNTRSAYGWPIVVPAGVPALAMGACLGVVIGRTARYVSEKDALRHVAGYCVVNDVSERDFQLKKSGSQWSKGKGCDTFGPLGPWLVTADEVKDPQNLAMWLDVNGERRQRGNTKTMIFGVATLVADVSRYMTLLPGDVITTGTPPGVGMGMKPQQWLRAGDVITLGIDRLGEQKQKVVPFKGRS